MLKRLLADLNGLQKKAKDENRVLTPDEITECERLMSEINAIRAQEDVLCRAEELNQWASRGTGRITGGASPDGNEERGAGGETQFRNIGEFLSAVVNRSGDPRLRTITLGDSSVGYLIPSNLHTEIIQWDPLVNVFAPDTQIVPPDPTSPDRGDTYPALDQESGLYDGVKFQWTGDPATTSTESAFKTKLIALQPHNVVGAFTLSNGVFRNLPAYSDYIGGIIRKAYTGLLDRVCLIGDGIAKPLGMLHNNNPALVKIKRKSAGAISYKDVFELMQAIHPEYRGRARFIAASDSLTSLYGMKDDSGRLIYGGQDVSQGRPATLMGLPLFYSDISTVGSEKDLSLVVPSAYLRKEGYGPALAMSEHAKFAEGKVAFRMDASLDGQPAMLSPLKLENGHTVSIAATLQ